MKIILLPALLAALLLTACDVYGVSRTASVTHVPDMDRLKARIMTYPEVEKATVIETEDGRPITLTGIKAPDRLWYLNYSGRNVSASVLFKKNHQDEVIYCQSSFYGHTPPPSSQIVATWPVMLRVERDLARHFGFHDLPSRVETSVRGVTLPK